MEQPRQEPESIWKKALREAGTVLLASIFLLFGFQLFASNAVPWTWTKPEAPEMEEAADADLFGDTADVEPPIDTAQVIDTTLSEEELEEARRDSIAKAEQARKDSIARAKKAMEDSIARAKKDLITATDPGSSDDVLSISTRQAKRLLDEKRATFIDARRSDQYAKGHIKGAINVYAYEVGNHVGDILGIPKDRQIVIYCDGGACEMSHDLADELKKNFGFTKIVIYQGGWEEWSKTDYPKGGE